MIGIIVAMEAEFRLTEALLEEKKECTVGGFRFLQGRRDRQELVIMQSGIGKVCAAAGAVEMIARYAPDCILNTGVAGGIDASLQVMDIVVGKEVVYHDVWCGEGNEVGQVQGMPARYGSDRRLYEAAISARSDVTLHGGLICSGDQFITDRQALDAIKGKFPEGLAVDMESGAIAQVCHMYGVPFLSCRVISDTPGRTENHALQYRDFWTVAPEKSFEVLRQVIAGVVENKPEK
ncbi:MAG: 5'-methylthioadenosine/adenosylhomocysteine nucleosidase [Odoribacter sp.]|nr:5'-methylthioadenosine/adenosylhomocysteine nucleosidase [Odoribacter sp.]